jgi:hypothetical protein
VVLTADATTIRPKTGAVLSYRRPELLGAVLISAVQALRKNIVALLAYDVQKNSPRQRNIKHKHPRGSGGLTLVGLGY